VHSASDIFIERVIKMKKRFLALLLVLCMVMSLLSVTAWADDQTITEVTDVATLKSAIAEGGSIKLGANIETSETFEVNKNVTIDLNGFTIKGNDIRAIQVIAGKLTLTGTGTVTSVGSVLYNSSVIRVGDDTATGNAELYIDENVTIEAPACYGVTIFGSATTETLTVAGKIHATGDHDKQNSATKSTDQCAISGNGSSAYGGTTITIKSTAEVTAKTDAAIYHPQSGTLTIEGGTISGTTGIEAKAGEATITVTGNPTIEATAKTTSHMSYSDGTSTQGYAIAVVENSAYAGSAKVTINSGSYTGPVAVVADDTVSEDVKGSLVINGGTFDDLSALDYLGTKANVSIDLAADATKNITIPADATVALNLGNYTINPADATKNTIITNGTLTISSGPNGKVTAGTEKQALRVEAATTTVNGGTFEGKYGAVVTGTGILDVASGTFKGTNVGIQAQNGGTLEVSRGTIEGGGAGVVCYNGDKNATTTVNISGGTVTGTGTSAHGMIVQGCTTGTGRTETKATATVSGSAEISGESCGVFIAGYGATLNVKSGSVSGKSYGISGNGTKNSTTDYSGTVINIIGGNIQETGSNGGGAIYHPQNGTLTISGDPVITGENGIELCSGEGVIANISGGSISATGSDERATKTGDGYIADGAALSIVNRSYPGGIPKMTITGGSFSSVSGAAVKAYTWSKNSDGKYVASEWKEADQYLKISGGIYSSSDIPCVVSGYSIIKNPDTTTNTTYPYEVGVKATSVSLPATAEVTYGQSLKLDANEQPTNATHKVTWTSSNTNVATVDQNGNITTKQAGETTITASVGDNEVTPAECKLTVNKANVTSLKLTPSTTSLEGGGTVTMTVAVEPTAADVEVTCSDTSITVTNNGNGTFTATLPNATVQYTFTAAVKSTDPCYQGSVSLPVSVTRYVAATTSASTSTSNKTDKTDDKTDDTATTLPTETGDVANTQVAPEVVSVETVTDAETGTVTTTTEKSDGSTTVVEEKTDGTVTTTDTSAEGAVKVVEKTTDGTVTTTDTAVNGVETYTKEVPGEQIKATVTIPEEVESAVVTIPVSGELTSGMVAMDADTGEIIMLSALTEDGLSLKLDGSRNIVIVDNSKSFTDVAADNWAADGVSFASSRGILIGTGENTFAPDATLDRRTALTGLARLAGIDTTGGDTWYEQAVEWAKETGISDGSNLEGDLPREQLATLLYRAAGSPEVDSSDVRYTDADQISSYATDAIAWATENGIMTGNPDGSVNPNGTANRAQYSTMLSRYAAYQMNH
jgi:hypothetical protein